MLERVSVHLSVCPAHAGNVSKLMTVGSCDIHRRVAQGPLVFCYKLSTFIYIPDPRGTPLGGFQVQTRLQWVKTAKMQILDPQIVIFQKR